MSTVQYLLFILIVMLFVLVPASHESPSVFKGSQCFPSGHFPLNACALPGACCCNSTCFMWMTGELEHVHHHHRHISQWAHKLPSPCYKKDYTTGRFSVVDDSIRYEGECKLTHYSPIQSDFILHDHTIIFYGDSLLRQLFNRFVWHLRGIPDVVEQYYHANAIYVRNGTHDALHIGPDDHMGTKHRLFNVKAHDLIMNPTLQLIYLWEPRLEDPDHVETQLNWAKDRFSNFTLVTGLNYWFSENEFQENLVLPQIERFQQIAKFPNLNFVWYPTPNYTYWQRNLFYQGHVDKDRSWILPTELLSNTSIYQHNRGDLIHYQCGMNLKFPQPIVNMDRFNTPESVNCRDMFDLNLVQVILNIIAKKRLESLKASV